VSVPNQNTSYIPNEIKPKLLSFGAVFVRCANSASVCYHVDPWELD